MGRGGEIRGLDGRVGDGGGDGGDDGGAAVRRQRRLGDGGIVVMTVKYPWPGQGVAAAAAVGLLPRLSLSSHLTGRALLSFFK